MTKDHTYEILCICKAELMYPLWALNGNLTIYLLIVCLPGLMIDNPLFPTRNRVPRADGYQDDINVDYSIHSDG